MSERLAHELLNHIDRRIAQEEDKDDAITRGYLLALRHMREKIEREEQYESESEVDS